MSSMHSASAETAILLVEDNPADARLVQEMVADAARAGRGYYRIHHVRRLGEVARLLEAERVDAVLLDLSLPDAHGLETLTRLHAAAPRLPIVVMSGCDDEVLAVEGVRAGAQDYLVKGRVDSDLLLRALRYAIERQRADDRLSAQTQALEAKTREQDAFIYTVAHDLKAPLVSLQGMAGILADEYAARLDADGQLYLRRIVANAEKMQTLLHDLLELSRVGRADGDNANIDLAHVVAEATEQLRHTLAARGAEVHVDGPLPVVHGSRTRLGQLFTNLIDNAVKYTPTQRAPRIAIAAADRGACWQIALRDNGVGIAPEFHDRVFGIFQRLPAGKALHPAGTGVGLAIVARIVETHGGTLGLQSQDDGTTFHFTLPKQEITPLAP